jgi:hypothetical protein
MNDTIKALESITKLQGFQNLEDLIRVYGNINENNDDDKKRKSTQLELLNPSIKCMEYASSELINVITNADTPTQPSREIKEVTIKEAQRVMGEKKFEHVRKHTPGFKLFVISELGKAFSHSALKTKGQNLKASDARRVITKVDKLAGEYEEIYRCLKEENNSSTLDKYSDIISKRENVLKEAGIQNLKDKREFGERAGAFNPSEYGEDTLAGTHGHDLVKKGFL